MDDVTSSLDNLYGDGFEDALDLLLRSKASYRGRPTTDREDRQSLAETSLKWMYQSLPTQDDLIPYGSSLQFITVDLSGRRVRVNQRGFVPFRVWARMLNEGDVQVFVTVQGNRVETLGWLPIARIEQASITWWEEEGVKKDYAHEIVPAVLNPMPSTFDFKEECPHVFVTEELSGKFGGIWDDIRDCWDCCGCGRQVDDYQTREMVKRSSNRIGNSVLSGTEASKRKTA